MHSSRWPTQNKVSCVFGGSLFHYVVSGHYFYFLFILYRSFAYVLWILVLCFDEISVCVNIIVCVYCGFSLAFFLVSSYSSLFVFILSSLNLCYMYYSFNALYVLLLQCFLMIEKSIDPIGRGRGEKLRGLEERKTVIRMCWRKKIYFQ